MTFLTIYANILHSLTRNKWVGSLVYRPITVSEAVVSGNNEVIHFAPSEIQAMKRTVVAAVGLAVFASLVTLGTTLSIGLCAFYWDAGQETVEYLAKAFALTSVITIISVCWAVWEALNLMDIFTSSEYEVSRN